MLDLVTVAGCSGRRFKVIAISLSAGTSRFRKNFDTEIPTVIVHGNWDINTPYENALELAPHFKVSKLVTIIGGSHGALDEALEESESFRDALMKFLSTGDMDDIPEQVELASIEWEIPVSE